MIEPEKNEVSWPRRVLAWLLGTLSVLQLIFSVVLLTAMAQGYDPTVPLTGRVMIFASCVFMTSFTWFGSRRAAGDDSQVIQVGNRVFMLIFAGAFVLLGALALIGNSLKHPWFALAVLVVVAVPVISERMRRRNRARRPWGLPPD